MERYILLYSIEDFIETKLFNNTTLLENFVNDKNEYEQEFKVISCYEIGREIFIEPIDFVTKYCIIEK